MTNHREIKYEDAPYSLRERVIALSLTLVVMAGAWQAIQALTPWSEIQLPKGWTAFQEGRTTHAVEDALNEKMPQRSEIIAVANSARWALLRGGGEEVTVGKDGWLFLTEELRNDPVNAAKGDPLNLRLDVLQHTQQALAKQGVALLVALVPDKARLYPNLPLPTGYPDYAKPRYQKGLDGLRERGIASVDLLEPFSRAGEAATFYYRTDTHWNQRGARLAATTIAVRARQMQACTDHKTYKTRNEGNATERPGDLLRMMGLADSQLLPRPRPDMEQPQVTEEVSQEAASESGLGLFGDVSIPVTLVGTSFSLRGNFHGALQEALSCEVLNAARDGAGFLQSMKDYVKDDAFRTAKPNLIIWEVPERFLTLPLDADPKQLPESDTSWLRSLGLQQPN